MRVLCSLMGIVLWPTAARVAEEPVVVRPALEFISTGFENASPLQWETDADGTVHVRLLYDYERNSPNRAAGHWHFQLQGAPETDLTLVLHNFENVYNARPGVAVSGRSICYVSQDGEQWKVIPAEFLDGNLLRLRVHLEGSSLYMARLEPYRATDLARLLDEIRSARLVEIEPIGKTVEGRPLEIVRVGDPQAPHGVLLRARAHAWEPGGNWVVQGLIRALLEDDETSRECLKRCCVYVMPMANKDAVARGLTRFNMLGRDLNRNWDRPADPKLAPENYALETWIRRMIRQGKPLDLAIDMHNDEGGGLHISRTPAKDLDRYLQRMVLFERLLRKHTWFTEGSSGPGHRNPGSLGEGLLERYGIDACIMEFNCNWIAGLKQHPSGAAWEQFGAHFRAVLTEYFDEIDKPSGDSR
ncbi:MAG TPA: M14-type cytosolic carboxypeptidase [Planctomycetota bacterium]|nr:M14-type cytosolic carboxypeptidase [Planctomycetota bacterium]